MADVLSIIQGISQALANKHDGAIDKEGKRVNIGLARDEEVPITDTRIIDGFNCKITGKQLIVTYNSELLLRDLHRKDFETDIKGYLRKAVSFIKSEYKDVTGETLTLTDAGEPDIFVEPISRLRSLVRATQTFTIGGLNTVENVGEESKDRLDKAFRTFLMLGKDKATENKPDNVQRAKNANEKPKKDKVLKEDVFSSIDAELGLVEIQHPSKSQKKKIK
jgi:hypothetical protein